MKNIEAKLNYLRMSPRKIRLVASLISGKKVGEALAQLDFLAKRAAHPIAKLLKSAINNAKNNFKIKDENNLKVKGITVDAGPTYKRSMPRARGMAYTIRKRTSKVTVTLAEDKPENKKQNKKMSKNE